MAFVRIKKIKGREYAYLVENTWKEKQSKQKVLKYLGSVLKLGDTEEVDSSQEAYATLVDDLLKQTMLKLSFNAMGPYLKREDITVDLEKREIRRGKRPVVLRVNEGFLCSDTWQQLHDLKLKKDQRGAEQFAKSILESGLRIAPEMVVRLFELMQ